MLYSFHNKIKIIFQKLLLSLISLLLSPQFLDFNSLHIGKSVKVIYTKSQVKIT